MVTPKYPLRWINGDFHSFYNTIKRQSILSTAGGSSYFDMLKETYTLMGQFYPNEYFIKNEFINSGLLRRIMGATGFLLNEFRVGSSIVDLAFFNSKRSIAFEIKSPMDSFVRLQSQVDQYKRLFNQVYLILPHNWLERYNSDPSVGLISFDLSRGKFTLVRKAKRDKFIDSHLLMQVLHTKEYLAIVERHCGSLPEMNAFTQFEVCSKVISEVSNEVLNSYFLDVISGRREEVHLSSDNSKILNQTWLSLKLNQHDSKQILHYLCNNTC